MCAFAFEYMWQTRDKIQNDVNHYHYHHHQAIIAMNLRHNHVHTILEMGLDVAVCSAPCGQWQRRLEVTQWWMFSRPPRDSGHAVST